jgi:heme exporter protein C
MSVAMFMGLVFAPSERVQGEVYRLLFVHVPSAWLAFLAFGVVAIASALYLIRGSSRWDHLAAASAEVGVMFTTLTLATGSIWGRSVWGVWWQWDPRLTTTLVMWFIYAGYLSLRAYIDEPEIRYRSAAVLGVLGVVSIPLVWFSVEWWRGLHPTPSITRPGGGMPQEMLITLLVSVGAFTMLYITLLQQRIRIQSVSEELTHIHEQLRDQSEVSP